MNIYAEATDGAGLTAYTDTPQSITVTGALFDRFTTASGLGFSLEQRKYRFFGTLLLVARSSDGAMANFGFIDGELDTAGILAFCGAGDGLIVNYHSQSAAANVAYQLTVGSMPRIVIGGVLVTASNGKPALDFDGLGDFMYLLSTASFVSGFFSYQNDATGTSALQEIIGGTTVAQVIAAGSVVTGFGASDAAGGGAVSTVKDTSRHYASVFTGSNDGVYVDGGTGTLAATGTITNITLIGNRQGLPFYMNGKIQDIIGYPDDQWANRAAIESYLS
jgi:hypothetical protein